MAVRYVSNHNTVAPGMRVTRVTTDGRFEILTDAKTERFVEVYVEGSAEPEPAPEPDPSPEPEPDPSPEVPGEGPPEEEIPGDGEASPPPDEGSGAPDPDPTQPPTPAPAPPPAPPSTMPPFGQYPAGAVDIDGMSAAQVLQKYNQGARQFVTSGQWGGKYQLSGISGAEIYWRGEQRGEFWLTNCQGVKLINPRVRNVTDTMRVFMQFQKSARDTEVHNGIFVGVDDPFAMDKARPDGILDQSRTGKAFDTRMVGVNFAFGGMSGTRCLVHGFSGDAFGLYRDNELRGCVVANAIKTNRNHDDAAQMRQLNQGGAPDNAKVLDCVAIGWTGNPNATRYRSEDGMAPPAWPGFSGQADPSHMQGFVWFGPSSQGPATGIEIRRNVVISNLWNAFCIQVANNSFMTDNIALRETANDIAANAPACRIQGSGHTVTGNRARAWMGQASYFTNDPSNKTTNAIMDRSAFIPEFNRDFLTLDVADFADRFRRAAIAQAG